MDIQKEKQLIEQDHEKYNGLIRQAEAIIRKKQQEVKQLRVELIKMSGRHEVLVQLEQDSAKQEEKPKKAVEKGAKNIEEKNK